MNTAAHGPQLYFTLGSQHDSRVSPQMDSGSLSASSNQLFIEMNRQNTSSSLSRNPALSINTRTCHRALQRDIRPRPPWIRSSDDEDSPSSDSITSFLHPPTIRTPITEKNLGLKNIPKRISRDGYIENDFNITRESKSERKAETRIFGGPKDRVKGRKWDHVRDGDPVIVQTGTPQSTAPWQIYVESSTFRTAAGEEGMLVDESFLDQLTPGYKVPWRGDLEGKGDSETHSRLICSKRQRRTLMKRIQYHLLMHPLVPLLFRLIVLTTSVIALGIATSIHTLSRKYEYSQRPSSTMAIVVDVIAIPYILYVTWDEYTGKPLGLRAPGAKIRLVLLDLFFIIFESANLSLAFGALTDDDGSCNKNELEGNPFNFAICSRFRALCAILMVALYAWSLTFAISIFRLVQRVGGKEEE